MSKVIKADEGKETARGDWGGSIEKPFAASALVRARIARLFLASPLSSAPKKTAMLRRLCSMVVTVLQVNKLLYL